MVELELSFSKRNNEKRHDNQKGKFAFTLAEGATHVTMPPTKMNFAFTLAEILITLGVIGVVAAMTIPTLITNIQDKHFKTAYKKSISDISQAMKLVYGETDENYTSVDWIQMPVYFCKLQKHMKVQSSGIDCSQVADDTFYANSSQWPINGTKNQWHSNLTWYDKKHNPQGLNSGYMSLTFTLLNGNMINFNCYNQIFVDVNGLEGPNTIGKDIFFMFFLDNSQSPRTQLSANQSVIPNGCSRGLGSTSAPTITKDNYLEDCLHGSGWGCSFVF